MVLLKKFGYNAPLTTRKRTVMAPESSIPCSQFECFDGGKPRLVRLAADVVFDYFEAVVPNGQVVLAHGEMG